MGVGRMPKRAPYATRVSVPVESDWLYLAAPPCSTTENSLSAFATGAMSSPAASARKTFLMCFLLMLSMPTQFPRRHPRAVVVTVGCAAAIGLPGAPESDRATGEARAAEGSRAPSARRPSVGLQARDRAAAARRASRGRGRRGGEGEVRRARLLRSVQRRPRARAHARPRRGDRAALLAPAHRARGRAAAGRPGPPPRAPIPAAGG